MWFGDLVTMRWWDDLWLNESFATYASVLAQVAATRWKNGWTTFANAEKSWAYRQDQLPSTHPIVADAADMEAVKTNFDGITYAKGACGAQAARRLGRQRGVPRRAALVLPRHEYGNTTLRDLLDALEEASGRDLAPGRRSGWRPTGVNTLRPPFEVDADGRFTLVRRRAGTRRASIRTLRSHRLAIGLYDRRADGARRGASASSSTSPASAPRCRSCVGARQPDLLLLNDDDLTYAKIRLDERSLDDRRPSSIGESGVAAARPVLGGGLGHDPRRRDGRPRLPAPGAGRPPAEADIGVVQSLLPGVARDQRLRRPGVAAPGAQALTDASLSCCETRNPAATSSWSTPTRSPRPRPRTSSTSSRPC